jgi:hypothetical protein
LPLLFLLKPIELIKGKPITERHRKANKGISSPPLKISIETPVKNINISNIFRLDTIL